jgi:hypothetical protein
MGSGRSFMRGNLRDVTLRPILLLDHFVSLHVLFLREGALAARFRSSLVVNPGFLKALSPEMKAPLKTVMEHPQVSLLNVEA